MTNTATKQTPPPIAGASDREFETRLAAAQVSLEFGKGKGRKLDTGKVPFSESPLFGGVAQFDLFGGAL